MLLLIETFGFMKKEKTMEYNTTEIIELINKHFELYPTQRFGQILFNLDINQFKDQEYPEKQDYQLRDIYSDDDSEIIKRIKQRMNK